MEFNELYDHESFRVPTIDEFIDGFTYIIYSPGWWEDSIEDFCGWYEYTMGKNNWRDEDDLIRQLEQGNIITRK
jgi:hypothetical protein